VPDNRTVLSHHPLVPCTCMNSCLSDPSASIFIRRHSGKLANRPARNYVIHCRTSSNVSRHAGACFMRKLDGTALSIASFAAHRAHTCSSANAIIRLCRSPNPWGRLIIGSCLFSQIGFNFIEFISPQRVRDLFSSLNALAQDPPFLGRKHPNLRGSWPGNGIIHSRHSRPLLLELARRDRFLFNFLPFVSLPA